MRCILVCYSSLQSNSGYHVASFAAGLRLLGWQVLVAAFELASTGDFSWFEVGEGGELKRQARSSGSFTPDIVHLWTPRRPCWQFLERHGRNIRCPVVLHLEDDETEILSVLCGERIPDDPVAARRLLSRKGLSDWSEPGLGHALSMACDANTVIAPSLQSTLPDPSASLHITPPLGETWFASPDSNLFPAALTGMRTLVYAGAIHAGVVEDFEELCKAVAKTEDRHGRLAIVRCGPPIQPKVRARLGAHLSSVMDLGFVSERVLHAILARATVLVQPGRQTAFNVFRFPSKIPPYLASGTPVVMPAAYSWLGVKDREHALLLHCGNADEIASALHWILANPEEGGRMGERAKHFARTCFDPVRCCRPLDSLYRRLGPRSKTRWHTFRRPRIEVPLTLAKACVMHMGTSGLNASTLATGERPPSRFAHEQEAIDPRRRVAESAIRLIETAGAEIADLPAQEQQQTVTAQLFWPTPQGPTESNSDTRILRSGTWIRLRFGPRDLRCDTKPRLDPVNRPGVIKIAGIAYRDRMLNLVGRWFVGSGLRQSIIAGGTISPTSLDAENELPQWISVGDDPQLLLPSPTDAGAVFIDVWIRWDPFY